MAAGILLASHEKAVALPEPAPRGECTRDDHDHGSLRKGGGVVDAPGRGLVGARAIRPFETF
jgi:hypothetical protein